MVSSESSDNYTAMCILEYIIFYIVNNKKNKVLFCCHWGVLVLSKVGIAEIPSNWIGLDQTRLD